MNQHRNRSQEGAREWSCFSFQGSIYQDWLLNENRYFKIHSIKNPISIQNTILLESCLGLNFLSHTRKRILLNAYPLLLKYYTFSELEWIGVLLSVPEWKHIHMLFLQDFFQKLIYILLALAKIWHPPTASFCLLICFGFFYFFF